jgi:DNA-binding MarR family transcriptional regulator
MEGSIPTKIDGGLTIGGDAEAFQAAVRVLTGVALRGLALSSTSVSLSQFRVLVVLDELGHSTAARLARVLRMDPSSVARLSERLIGSGHVVRRTHTYNRRIVTLELTPAGQSLVLRVMHWRHHALGRILDRLDADRRVAAVDGIRAFVDAAGGSGYGSDHITDGAQ